MAISTIQNNTCLIYKAMTDFTSFLANKMTTFELSVPKSDLSSDYIYSAIRGLGFSSAGDNLVICGWRYIENKNLLNVRVYNLGEEVRTSLYFEILYMPKSMTAIYVNP